MKQHLQAGKSKMNQNAISPFVIIGKKPSAHVCSKRTIAVKFFETGVHGETDKSELCFG